MDGTGKDKTGSTTRFASAKNRLNVTAYDTFGSTPVAHSNVDSGDNALQKVEPFH